MNEPVTPRLYTLPHSRPNSEPVVSAAGVSPLTLETLCGIAYWCPIAASVVEVCAEEELQIVSALQLLTRIIGHEWLMPCNILIIGQVNQIPEQIETILSTAAVVVDVNLWFALLLGIHMTLN